MTEQFPDISDLIPHRDTMQLISQVIADANEELTAEVLIRPDHPFLVAGKGVPTYVALEMMAQSICAKDGLDQIRLEKPPAIGFLLGCQRFQTSREWLQVGERLTAHVFCRLDAGELGSFDCELRGAEGDIIAKGSISVFRPHDVAQFLKESEIET
ncbi:MAG: hypothetical protein ACPGVA_03830 [Pikeienuella sp.]